MRLLSERRNGFGSLALAILVAGLLGASAPASGPGGQDKVGRFLDFIMKAASLDQVSQTFQRERFSEAEVRRIETEVGKDSYRRKLAGLKPGLPLVQLNKLEVTRKAVAVPKKSAARTTSGPAAKLKTSPAQASWPKSAAPRTLNARAISAAELHAITGRPGGGTEARISAVSPSSLRPGRSMAIAGSGFGRGRGSVEIILERRRYICDLESWSESSIRAVVPEYMDGIVGERARDALLWVKLSGQSLGPTHDIRLMPDPAATAPEILSLGSGEIGPGEDLAVWGRNFGRARGAAWCVFGRARVELDVTSWTDADIRVHLPDEAGGMPAMRGALHIRTGDGKESSRPIGFAPVLEEIVISTYVEGDCSFSTRVHDQDFVLFRGARLANGWVIAGARLERVSGSGSYEYLERPKTGTPELAQTIRLAAAAFSELRVASRMTIRGPRGTSHF